jgi:hypothetical protein
MRTLTWAGAIAALLAVAFPLYVTPAAADMREVVSLLLRVCMAGGTSEQLETQAQGEVALTLKALKSGNIGGNAGVAGKFSKSDWEGLQGGISSSMTELQAGQADKARACLQPYMAGIVQAILLAK